jgi:hypothetical protein
MGVMRNELTMMADPMQIRHSVLLAPVARRRRSTAGYHARWWAVAAVLFFLVYGSIFVLVRVIT